MEVAAVAAPSPSFWRHGAAGSAGAAELQFRGCKNAGRELTKLRVFLCSSSIQDSRSKPWNDANLARELREFMVANGLPSDKVPSTKELASNGRQDLANVVRRRGYKAIAQLLASTPVSSQPVVGNIVDESCDALQPQVENDVVLNGSARTEDEERASHHQLEYLDVIRPPSPDVLGVDSSQVLEEKAEKFLRTGEFSSDQENEALSTTEESDSEDEALEMVALRKAALLRSKLTPFISSRETVSQDEQIASEKLFATTNKVQDLLEKDKGLQSQSKDQAPVFSEDLKVKIEWWGVASKVELAGSFNGWQHFFVLEPDLSSEIVKPDGSR
ncbi:uncharacterized protein LOC112345306 [Selaginella moellendorffii]|uniref:uncharacterized protein LOC112345306 n=1 Tax=Selaginella moellendorffii TaxID=88036 RepID=UPI000D1CB883|nr:uncharacterized protein LOC112345306 [Selaginella moellendorffii]|eukprot:XP_024527504.1 uncharacterized protein LOC112345306 [Selaginella moellendorffii]